MSEYPPVPYVSQVGNSATNDCGPAVCVMLGRWVGKSMNLGPVYWADYIGKRDQLTSRSDLERILIGMGCTPVTGIATRYPRIELVSYPKLPKRYLANYTGNHWIVRLSETQYSDPLWPTEAQGSYITASKATLDAANLGASYYLGIQERPTPMTNNGAPRQQYQRVVHVLPPDATAQRFREVADAAFPAKQTVGFSYDDAGVGALDDRTAILWDIPADKRAAFSAFYAQYYPGVKVVFKPDAATPPPQPPPATSTRGKWGFNTLYSMAAAQEAIRLGARTVTMIDVGPGVKELALKHPDVLFIHRVTSPTGSYPNPVDLVNRLGVDASWPANVVCVGINEDDNVPTGQQSFKNSQWIRERFAVDSAIWNEIRRRAPNVQYAASIYPPIGKPEEAELMRAMQDTYVRSANGWPSFWLDFHNYARDKGTLWSVNAKGEQEHLFYELRIKWLVDAGLDPARASVIYSESGVDHMGIGGVPAEGMTQDNWRMWLERYDALHTQYGLQGLVKGGAMWQLGDSQPPPMGRGGNGRWAGYELWNYRDATKAFYAGSTTPIPPAPEPPPVKPPPVTPPTQPITVTARRLLGIHALTNTGAANQAISNGAEVIAVMGQPTYAYQIAAGNNVTVMHRHYWRGYLPTAEDFVRWHGIDPNAVNNGDKRIILGCNENDQIGSSALDIRRRAEFDRAVWELLKRCTPNARYAGGGWAHGTPDITSADVKAALRDWYAPLYNAGMLVNVHLYTYGDIGQVSPIWFERRWQFFFTDCGFDTSIRGLVCDETGLEGPNGGFPGNGWTQEKFRAWCEHWLAVSTEPLNGKPSPLIAATLFTGGDNGDPQWGRYDVRPYYGTLASVYSSTRRNMVNRFGVVDLWEGDDTPQGYRPQAKVY